MTSMRSAVGYRKQQQFMNGIKYSRALTIFTNSKNMMQQQLASSVFVNRAPEKELSEGTDTNRFACCRNECVLTNRHLIGQAGAAGHEKESVVAGDRQMTNGKENGIPRLSLFY